MPSERVRVQAHPRQPVGLALLFWKVHRYLRRRAQWRRRHRVLKDFDLLLSMCDEYPDLRKHVRKVLRVRGYES